MLVKWSKLKVIIHVFLCFWSPKNGDHGMPSGHMRDQFKNYHGLERTYDGVYGQFGDFHRLQLNNNICGI